MLTHKKREKNPERRALLNKGTERMSADGLNNVQYILIGTVKYPLFTYMAINTGDPMTDKRK